MPSIETNDYQGKNRRNGRLKLKTSDWIKIVLLSSAIIAGGAKLQMSVMANSKAIDKVEEVPTQIAVTQKDVEYLKDDVLEVKVKVDELSKEQKEMRQEMNDNFTKILMELRNNR